MFRRLIWVSSLLLLVLIPVIPQIVHHNLGVSHSTGQVHKGSLQKAYKLDWQKNNTVFFSKFSYYILGRAYVNSRVYNTIYGTHSKLARIIPGRKFIIMECSRRSGGRMYPHKTHQNGLSIDFFTPLIKKSKPRYYKVLGAYRYLLNFDEQGRRGQVEIDFDVMAKHILELEKQARNYNLKIKKVIFRIDLKDELFQSKHGRELKNSGIYFAKNLTPTLNKLHDDHYHVDFEVIE